MKYSKFKVFGLILFHASICCAQEPAFNLALNELLNDCPEITILRKSNEAVVETERSVNKPSDPEIEFNHVWGRHGVGNKFDITVTQGFDWPAIYKARAKAISAQTNANILLEQTSLLNKTTEIKALMIDIIFQKKNLVMSQFILDHMVQLEEATKESYRKGEISKLEFKRTELERVQTAIQLRENERVLNELYTSLEAATGKKNYKEIMNTVEDVPTWSIASESEYEDMINRLNPRMAYLRATIEAIEATSNAERMTANYPSFNLGYLFQREQGETFNGFSMSFTLPVYGSRHVRNAAKANIVSAQLEAQMEQISILSRMRAQRQAALSLAKELDDYSTIFEHGNYSELLKLALDGGETDNIHYLQELNFYIEVIKQYIELQHQYNLTLASLNCYDIFNEDGRNF